MATDPLLDPATAQLDLWKLASAIDRGGAAVHGVEPGLLADVLEVSLVDRWRSKDDGMLTGPYRPLAIMRGEDGTMRRTFAVPDLADQHEDVLRRFAEKSANAFVRARIFDLLWVRYRKHQFAHEAIDALSAAASLCSGEDGWPDLVTLLGRAGALILETNARTKLPTVITVLEEAGGRIVGGRFSFGFGRLAEMARLVLLSASWAKQQFGSERAERWTMTLGWLAQVHLGDPHHGQNAFDEQQAWLARWGRQKEQRLVQEQLVDALLDVARAQPKSVAPMTLQDALGRALAFGLPEHVERARLQLSEAIRASTSELKPISGAGDIPAEALRIVERIVECSSSTASALRQLAVVPGFLEVPLEDFRAATEERLNEQVFWRFARSVHYHDGKITFGARNDDAKRSESLALFASFHQALVEALLGYFLQLIQDRFREDTLVEALAAWPHLASVRRPLLQRASERFLNNDFISSGVLVVTLYEAVLRDLLRAGGHSALRTDASGVMADETLNSLLQNPATKTILGERHVWFVEHLLCRPHLGPNFRNAVAHGTATIDNFTPTRVLLAWLLLLRLTCFTWKASPPATTGDTEQQSPGDDVDGAAQAPPRESDPE